MGLYVDCTCTCLEHSILEVKYVMHILGQSKQCYWNEYGSFRVKSTNGVWVTSQIWLKFISNIHLLYGYNENMQNNKIQLQVVSELWPVKVEVVYYLVVNSFDLTNPTIGCLKLNLSYLK